MKTSHNTELDKLFKEMYYFENERKHRLITSLSIPIAILSIIFGVMTKYMDNIIFHYDIHTVCFAILFGVATLSIIIAVIYFACSFFFYSTYKLFPTPEKITKYNENLRKHYENSERYDQKEINELIENDLKSFIAKTHKECLETNINNNDRRAAYLHRTNVALISAIFFLVLSSIPYYIKYHSISKIQKTEIINSEGGEINVR